MTTRQADQAARRLTAKWDRLTPIEQRLTRLILARAFKRMPPWGKEAFLSRLRVCQLPAARVLLEIIETPVRGRMFHVERSQTVSNVLKRKTGR